MNRTNASTTAGSEDAKEASTLSAAQRPSALGERVRSLRLPAEVRAHRSSTSVALWLMCLVMTGAAAAFGYLYYQQLQRNVPLADEASGSSAATPAAPEAPGGVQLPPAPAKTASSSIALEAKGYVVPRRKILVSPQVNGRLLKVMFEEGNRVQEGQVLAEFETTDYAADRDRAQAMLASAEQRAQELDRGYLEQEKIQAIKELEEATIQLGQAKKELERNVGLRTRDAISKLEFEQSEATYNALTKKVERLAAAEKLMSDGPRQERIAAAKAEADQFRQELVRTQWRLDNCIVKAPISGTILRKNAEEGNIVNPIAFNGSYSLCEMADLSDLEVELFIQERDISRVFVGQSCQVRAEAYPDRTYEGAVSRLMPIADRAKGAVPVRVKLTVPADEEGVYLKPEMGAIVTFLKGPQ